MKILVELNCNQTISADELANIGNFQIKIFASKELFGNIFDDTI